ncbi:MAG: riboflavin biosynthesis protein RibF [Bacillales bacterium]|jgi:riboflavin kinase/FMN adenylyltransferase|nr:riboflavin biosynthesis protein RibF [Bacillales bacterium]
MEVYNITINDIPDIKIDKKLSLALGYFDGVHKGHKKVISTCVEIAKSKNISSAVMTLEPHPLKVLKPEKSIECITNIDQRIRYIEQLGVEYLIVLKFDIAISELSPAEFMNKILKPLNAQEIIAGFDYRFGRNGEGNMTTLTELGRGSFNVTTIDKVESENIKISSTLIRKLICEGNVDKVEKYLEKKYKIIGKVIHGEKRGRSIGYPTANILPNDNYVVPKTGVYIVKIVVNSITYNGVCNVGLRPTFHLNQLKPNIEVHILDFNEEIYGKYVEVIWYKKIRDEKKFNSINELILQLDIDSNIAKSYFQKINSSRLDFLN